MGACRRARTVLAAAVLLAGAGCGRQFYPVEGVVTLDGKPVEGATISFIPDEGSQGPVANGLTRKDGSFRLETHRAGDGVLAGTYKVVISKTPAIEFHGLSDNEIREMALKQEMGLRAKIKKEIEGQLRAKKGEIPAVYGDPARSTLKVTVPTTGKVRLELQRSGGA